MHRSYDREGAWDPSGHLSPAVVRVWQRDRQTDGKRLTRPRPCGQRQSKAGPAAGTCTVHVKPRSQTQVGLGCKGDTGLPSPFPSTGRRPGPGPGEVHLPPPARHGPGPATVSWHQGPLLSAGPLPGARLLPHPGAQRVRRHPSREAVPPALAQRGGRAL